MADQCTVRDGPVYVRRETGGFSEDDRNQFSSVTSYFMGTTRELRLIPRLDSGTPALCVSSDPFLGKLSKLISPAALGSRPQIKLLQDLDKRKDSRQNSSHVDTLNVTFAIG